jgi:hypothetical protein
MHLPAPHRHLSGKPNRHRAAVAADDGIVRNLPSDFPGKGLRFHRRVDARTPILHHFRPVAHALLRTIEEVPVLSLLQQRQQHMQSCLGVSRETNLNRVTEPNLRGIPVDLHCARLPRLGIVFDVRKRRPDEQERVARFHHFDGGPRAQQSNPTGGIRRIIGHARFAQ